VTNLRRCHERCNRDSILARIKCEWIIYGHKIGCEQRHIRKRERWGQKGQSDI
jgi:hypothetical protein